MFLFIIVILFAAFFFSRSSKELPKNWSQLKAEISWQYVGARGLIEDYWLRKHNRDGKYLDFDFFGRVGGFFWNLSCNISVLSDIHTHTHNLIRIFVAIQTETFDQPGRTAVITGGNRGIGADVVVKLLQCRINVVLGEFSN